MCFKFCIFFVLGLWSPVWRSWWTAPSSSPALPQTILGTIPACPPMDCWLRLLHLPISLWHVSVYVLMRSSPIFSPHIMTQILPIHKSHPTFSLFPVFLSDPAQALLMPPQTYLPTGLRGLVSCPVRAQPPLLRVDWTKDGQPLDLAMVQISLISPLIEIAINCVMLLIWPFP